MDLNKEYGLAEVRTLIGSANDKTHTQLRVTKHGIAFISATDVGSKNINDLAFRLETWSAGNGYVGFAAAKNELWCERILKVLQENWPSPTSSYIDVF